MNDTVARIVDLMFQDVEMNEEVTAIRDEVMNNCQERFNDLVAAGMSEDDAIAAVVESLKGMEDVLAPYERKMQSASPEEGETEDEEQHLIFASHLIHMIDLTLVNEDVKLEASDDNDYHVLWNREEMPQVQAAVNNGVLRIDRRLSTAGQDTKNQRGAQVNKNKAPEIVHMENGEFSINMNGIEVMLQNVANSLKNAFNQNNIHINIGFGHSAVTIRIPELTVPHVKVLTTSGDVSIENAAMADMNITSTSGDITIDLDKEESLARAEIRTTSGDIEATLYAQELMVCSTSGDVEIDGSVSKVNVSTISGDIDVRADAEHIAFKAVSGDVDIEIDNEEIREIIGNTISGDIDIDLPSGLGVMGIQTHTRSGDVTTRYRANGVGPTVTGEVTSMSGDITIR